MTAQQVNLYQPIFRREKKVFSARTLFAATAVVAVGLLAIYGVALWKTEHLERQLRQQRAALADSEARLTRLGDKYAARRPDPALRQQLDRLRSERNVKLDMLERLQHAEFGNTQGFSSYMGGLARQHLPELWLTRVGIHNGGAELMLEGSAMEPTVVPRYLQRLSGEAVFSGKEFRSVLMQRPDEQDWHIDFTVATAMESPE